MPINTTESNILLMESSLSARNAFSFCPVPLKNYNSLMHHNMYLKHTLVHLTLPDMVKNQDVHMPSPGLKGRLCSLRSHEAQSEIEPSTSGSQCSAHRSQTMWATCEISQPWELLEETCTWIPGGQQEHIPSVLFRTGIVY